VCLKAGIKNTHLDAKKRTEQSFKWAKPVVKHKKKTIMQNRQTRRRKTNNTTKRIVLPNLMNISSPHRREKQNTRTNKRVKRTHSIGKILQKQNTTN